MKKYDYLLVGAGITNAVFAHFAVKAKKKVLVIDRRRHIGGNCFTEKRKGITVHKYGPHIFHTNDKIVWDFVNSFGEFKPFINSPIAVNGGEVLNLPFNMNTFSRIYGTVKVEEIKKAIKRDGEGIIKPKNFEESCISQVGRPAYEKLVKGYTEKQWGMPASKLPADLINRLPFRLTFNNNYFDDRYQGIPSSGYTSLIEKMLDGADVLLGYDFYRHKSHLEYLCKEIIFSGPIDEYYNFRYGKLGYRGLKFEEEEHPVDNVNGTSVINYTNRDIPFTREIEHKHFLGEESSASIVTKEYPANEGEPYYPINNAENESIFLKYKQLADAEKGITFVGRLGSYQYMNMDKCVKEAIALSLARGL